MLLTKFGLRGWKSYDHEVGLELEHVGQFSAFIGPNNVGKSNAGKLLVWLRRALFPFVDQNREPWGGDTWGTLLNLPVKLSEQDRYGFSAEPVIVSLSMHAPDIGADEFSKQHFAQKDVYSLRIEVKPGDAGGRLSIMPLSNSGVPLFSKENKIYTSPKQYDAVGNHRHKGLIHALAAHYVKSVIDIQPLRDFARQQPQSKDENSSDGGRLFAELERARTGHRHEWQRIQDDLESWLGRLLGETSPPRLEIAPDDIRVRFTTGNRLQISLVDLGTGVAEALMILAFLRVRKGQYRLAVMDEPEAHLHPAAATELMRIMTDELKVPQLVVATHSSTIVDSVDTRWTLYRASAQVGTKIERLESDEDRLALLRQLGLKPSQLFMANTVLWVEGPTDAVYLRALIRTATSDLLEGRDFAFAIYGGALMSNLSFDTQDEARIVKLFKISTNPIAVADADRTAGVVRSAIEQLRATNKADRRERVYVPPGREIENVARPEVLIGALRKVLPSVGAKDKPLTTALPQDFTLADIAFDVHAADAATVDGRPLSADEKKSFREKLNARKPRIAELVCQSNDPFSDAAKAWAKTIVAAIRPSERP